MIKDMQLNVYQLYGVTSICKTEVKMHQLITQRMKHYTKHTIFSNTLKLDS